MSLKNLDRELHFAGQYYSLTCLLLEIEHLTRGRGHLFRIENVILQIQEKGRDKNTIYTTVV